MAFTHLKVLAVGMGGGLGYFRLDGDSYPAEMLAAPFLLSSTASISYNGFFGTQVASFGASEEFVFDLGALVAESEGLYTLPEEIGAVHVMSFFAYSDFEITVSVSEDGVAYTEVGFASFTGETSPAVVPISLAPPPPRNRLLKDSLRTYIPGTPGVTGNPGRPYLPARWTNVTEEVCTYGIDYNAMIAAGWTQQYFPPNQQQASNHEPGAYLWISPASFGTNLNHQILYSYTCTQQTRQVFVPAQTYIAPTAPVAPVASQTILDHQLGWSGRARSIKTVAGVVKAAFKAPASLVGAVVGLATQFDPSGYGRILFGFYLSHGIARAMEQGQIAANFGTYPDGATFRLTRSDGRIKYFIDGVEVRDVPNDSSPMFLDAALYSGGDFIYDPELEGGGESHAALRALTGFSGEGVSASSAGELVPLTGAAGVFLHVNTVMSGLTGLSSNRPYAESRGELTPISGAAEAGLILPSYAIASGAVSIITGQSSMLTGTVGNSAGVMSPLAGLSSEGTYGESHGVLAGLTGSAEAMQGNGAVSITFAGVSEMSFTAIGGPLPVVMMFEGGGIALFTVQVVADAAFLARGTGALNISFESILHAYMNFTGQGGGLSDLSESAVDVWTLNTENNGSTRYEGYDYNSFAKIGDSYFGCKAGGIYALDGDDDAGEPIQAMVSFGKQDFGTTALKRVTNVYLGASSTGKLFVKVLAEGEEYLYEARDSSEAMQTQRVDLGRGLRANFLEFELYNADGDDFELASVEFAAVPLTRRI